MTSLLGYPCSTCTAGVLKHAVRFAAKFEKFSQQRKATAPWTCYCCTFMCLLSQLFLIQYLADDISWTFSWDGLSDCAQNCNFSRLSSRTTMEHHTWTMMMCSVQEMFQLSQFLISMPDGEHRPARLSVSFWSEQRSHSCTLLQSPAQPVIARYNLWV